MSKITGKVLAAFLLCHRKCPFFPCSPIEKTKNKNRNRNFPVIDCLSISLLAWCCMIDHEGSKVAKNYNTIKKFTIKKYSRNYKVLQSHEVDQITVFARMILALGPRV